MNKVIRYFRRILIATVFLIIPLESLAHEIKAPAIANLLVETAEMFLNSLSSKQRQAIEFNFADNERFNWHYIPRNRVGLAIKDMTPKQRGLAMEFLKAGLSQKGYYKTTQIIKLEAVLQQIETWNWMDRDPEKYYFSFFGKPSKNGTWGWRFEGHHISLNITIVKGLLLATAPRFLGANPAEVRTGEFKGVRPLKQEEYLARQLMRSLNQKQKKKAVFRKHAYRDIVTSAEKQVSPLVPVGISAMQLKPLQRKLLISLIEEYVTTLPVEIARQKMNAILNNDFNKIYFGWAGSLILGQPHYYRIQTPTFLIEYDNVQNGSNHIHTVWRGFERDFGRDLLKRHYLLAH